MDKFDLWADTNKDASNWPDQAIPSELDAQNSVIFVQLKAEAKQQKKFQHSCDQKHTLLNPRFLRVLQDSVILAVPVCYSWNTAFSLLSGAYMIIYLKLHHCCNSVNTGSTF